MAHSVGSPGFNDLLVSLNLAELGMSCRSWAAMPSELDRSARIVPWLASKYAAQTPAEVHAVIEYLDAGCRTLEPPSGSDLAPTCEDWARYTRAEKLTRIRAYFDARAAAVGLLASSGWVSDTDIAQVFTAVETECVTAGRTAIDETRDATALVENTRVEVTITSPSVPFPQDGSITLDGVAMTILRANPPSLTFERHGLAPGNHTLAVSGSGIVSISQTISVAAGAAATAMVVLQAQPASLRVAVAAPTGASAEDAVVTLGGTRLARGPDGSYTSPATGFAPGTFDLCVTAPGFEQQCRSVVLAPGATLAEGFALRASPASIAVTVEAVAGTLPDDVAVLLDGRAVPRTSSGAFVMAGVQPGEHVVSVSASGFVGAQQNVTVVGGQAATATFTMAVTATGVPIIAPVAVVVPAPPVAVKSNFLKWLVGAAAVVFGVKYAMDKGEESVSGQKRENPPLLEGSVAADLHREVDAVLNRIGSKRSVRYSEENGNLRVVGSVDGKSLGRAANDNSELRRIGARYGFRFDTTNDGNGLLFRSVANNPTASQVVPVVVGVAALGAAYLVSRPAQAMTSVASSNPAAPATYGTPARPRTPASTATPGDSVFATDAHPTSSSTLVSRLAMSTGVRQLFAFQALLYSSRFTDYLPDGVMGDHTRAMIRDINRRVNDTTSNDSFGVGMYARAEQARVAAGKPLDRLIPALPQATITAVNQAIRSMAAGPLLQVHATASAAAA